jgi:ABC-type branched-subunit amino acid transport system substrate-binding protein
MTRRRYLIAGACLGVLALVAAACGGSSKTSSTTTTAGTTATTAGTGSTAPAAPKTLAAAPGFDPSSGTIHLGVITPLTGPAAVIGKPLTVGTETWFKYVNSQGGIAGKYKVVLDEEDSQYTPQLAVQDYNKIKDGDVMIAQLLGTPETNAVLPLLRQDNIIAAPASLDAAWVHDPNLLPVGAPYQFQMINAADYVINTLGLKSSVVCSFIQDDTYGGAGEQGLDFAAKQLSFSVKTTAKYTAGATDVTAQVQQLKSSGCQVVYLVSTPDITAITMAKAAQLQFTPQWVGASPTWLGAFAKSALAPYLEAHFIVAGEGPEWGDTTVKGMADLITRTQQLTPSQGPDGYYGFGYYQGWAVTNLLNKAVELGDLSRAGIAKALSSLGTVSFDGLTGDYNYGTDASSRVPPRETTIFKVNPAKGNGLEAAKVNFVTDTAKGYTLPSS